MLKKVIYSWTGIPPTYQVLSFHGAQLDDDISLSEYKEPQKCIIHVARIGGSDGQRHDSQWNQWHPIMGSLELDHFRYLLEKIVKEFSDGKQSHEEVVLRVVKIFDSFFLAGTVYF